MIVVSRRESNTVWLVWCCSATVCWHLLVFNCTV